MKTEKTAPPPFLRILLGPTASGKEGLALLCAERIAAEIVSVDSMKIYRGLDIGTAKPDAETRARIRHHCLDIAEPTEVFSVARYVEAADAAIAAIAAGNKPPLLSGGTALYYKGLLQGLFSGPRANPGLRRSLRARAESEGPQALYAELERLDPATASRVHPNDLRRVIRALEVAMLTGRPISEQQTQWTGTGRSSPSGNAAAPGSNGFPGSRAMRYPCAMVALEWPRETLYRRIEARVEQMLAAGLVEEARRVYENRDTYSPTPLQAVGYKEFFPYFEGGATMNEAIELLRKNTRNLAKSQDTWFRKFPCHRLRMHEDRPREEVVHEILRIWENYSQNHRRISP